MIIFRNYRFSYFPHFSSYDSNSLIDDCRVKINIIWFHVTGISTWGRKVGRRWDQLKRSDSSELLSVSGRRRRWSPNRKAGTTDEKENVSMLLSHLFSRRIFPDLINN